MSQEGTNPSPNGELDPKLKRDLEEIAIELKRIEEERQRATQSRVNLEELKKFDSPPLRTLSESERHEHQLGKLAEIAAAETEVKTEATRQQSTTAVENKDSETESAPTESTTAPSLETEVEGAGAESAAPEVAGAEVAQHGATAEEAKNEAILNQRLDEIAAAEATAKAEEAARQGTTTVEMNVDGTIPAAESPVEKNGPFDVPAPSQERAENPADILIPSPRDEHTPKEWRENLRGLITSAKEKLGMSERGERLTSYLKDRSAKLDANASELGVVEKSFRALGERYNKLGWKSKLGVGLALGVGSAAFSGVSLPIAFACTSGLTLQRVAGMASVFLKYEKKGKALGKEGGLLAQKEKAFLKAMLYSAGMSLAIGEAVFLASESSYGEAVHEWLKQNWPSGGSEVQTDIPASPEESLSTETSAPTSEMSPANPAEAPSTEPELEMQQPETVPSAETSSSAAPASEEALVSPDTGSASNPEVASADTRTADLVAKEFGAEYAGPEIAPEVAAQTDLSAQEWRAEYAEPVNHTGAPDWRAEHTDADFTPETPEETHASADTAPQAPVTEGAVTAPEAVPTDTAPDTTAPTDAPTAPPQSEASTAPAPETSHFVVNTHGLSIDEAHAGAYLNAQGNHIIFGGTLDERFQEASKLVARDNSDVYFDSTREKGFFDELFNRKIEPLTTKLSWVESDGGTIKIEELNNLPSGINDLAQVYKPAN